ncbi:MAG TPA: response regulator [Herpetosiphonaceae bacterium]
MLIEDRAEQASYAQYLLEAVGFEVVIAENIAQASLEIDWMLDPQREYRRTLILIDFKGVHPSRPDLEGPNWVAVVARKMQEHQLYPAPIVAISSYLTEERKLEARVAGCHQCVLEKPFSDEHAIWLRQLVMEPPTIPHANASPEEQLLIRAFQSTSARSLQSIFEPSVVWTAANAYLMLRRLTTYPAQRPEVPRDQELTERLLHVLGGVSAARELLQSVADLLKENGEIHGEILAQFLAGRKRREIVKFYEDIYDDSHIYNSIKSLPARLYQRLKTFPYIR